MPRVHRANLDTLSALFLCPLPPFLSTMSVLVPIPLPSSSSSSSPTRSPLQRPPSRSERLLRDTLRRDELALAQPSPPRHRRRHSTPIRSSPNDDSDCEPDYIRTAVLLRTTIPPTSSPRHPRSTESEHRHTSRPASPTPSSRREAHDLAPLTLTPHEQVLRTRLERVLQAGRAIVRAESREQEREREPGRRKSTQSSGRSDDSDDPWLWRDSATYTLSSSPKQERFRSKPEAPVPLTPPSPSTPPRSRSHSKSSRSQSNAHTPHREHQHQHHPQQHQPEPLTPPPTPPTTTFPVPSTPHTPQPSHAHAHLGHMPTHPSTSPHAFNVRTASARCRQMEGYVSFAAVEGLGEPPADDESVSESHVSEEGKGHLLGRIWRVLGGEGGGR
jgi:hypothetical protein